jgi:hypothetical protein
MKEATCEVTTAVPIGKIGREALSDHPSARRRQMNRPWTTKASGGEGELLFIIQWAYPEWPLREGFRP